ncbi:hypothetical protein ACP70R_014312 [Stipagrostis hirtigluma subsp. patula]
MAVLGAVAACATAATAAAAAVLALTTSSSSSCDRTRSGTTAAEADYSPAPSSRECAVCLSEMAAGAGRSDSEPAAVRTLPACGHGFHAECIGRWLPLRPECPLCRRPVVPADECQAAARAVVAAPATAAPAWARPARIACGFGDGRVVWTRSPSAQL